MMKLQTSYKLTKVRIFLDRPCELSKAGTIKNDVFEEKWHCKRVPGPTYEWQHDLDREAGPVLSVGLSVIDLSPSIVAVSLPTRERRFIRRVEPTGEKRGLAKDCEP